jgi:hypothetical protein
MPNRPNCILFTSVVADTTMRDQEMMTRRSKEDSLIQSKNGCSKAKYTLAQKRLEMVGLESLHAMQIGTTCPIVLANRTKCILLVKLREALACNRGALAGAGAFLDGGDQAVPLIVPWKEGQLRVLQLQSGRKRSRPAPLHCDSATLSTRRWSQVRLLLETGCGENKTQSQDDRAGMT